MNIEKIIIHQIASGKPHFPVTPGSAVWFRFCAHWMFWVLLYGLSLVYRGIIAIRAGLYRKRLLKQGKLPRPVISIGNITTGGTGKTPMVILVAQILQRHGKRTAILSRGYQRKGRTVKFSGNACHCEESSTPPPSLSLSPNLGKGSGGVEIASQSLAMTNRVERHQQENKTALLTEGECVVVDPNSDVRTVGDEPLLIARKFWRECNPTLPNVPVIVGKNRYHSGQFALERFHPDVILLDDGFQHLQLARACDLVLIDATNPFGGGYLLPAGLLREPLDHLDRATAFVITRSNEVADLTAITQQLQVVNPAAPIFTAQVVCESIRHGTTGEVLPAENLQDQRLLAIAGVGNPASFQRLLMSLKLFIIANLDFPDHHWYSAADAETIRQTIETHQLDAIITTEKDEAKLLPLHSSLSVPVYTVTIAMRVQPEQAFETFFMDMLRTTGILM